MYCVDIPEHSMGSVFSVKTKSWTRATSPPTKSHSATSNSQLFNIRTILFFISGIINCQILKHITTKVREGEMRVLIVLSVNILSFNVMNDWLFNPYHSFFWYLMNDWYGGTWKMNNKGSKEIFHYSFKRNS